MGAPYDAYELVCGLEVHLQLKTASKAYSGDKNEYGALPNTLVDPLNVGMPGTLPVVNKRSVELAIRLGLAFDCEIAEEMHFARKNYFYADLPKGYQITQDTTPICSGGHVHIKLSDGRTRDIELTRIHMEEDAGKSIHDQDPFNTLVDLNRAGVPLVEVVSEPVIYDPEEAYAYLTEIRRVVRYLDVCDGNMEEGSMRCDANVSVRKKGIKELGQRTEVKNMNSFRNVQRAIAFEMKRQIDILESGGSIHMETRSYDAVNDRTFGLRSKELAHDYRYFPEPDIQPLLVTREDVAEVRKSLPPLPRELHKKYTEELGLSAYDAGVLTEEKEIALYFEALLEHTPKAKSAANWVMGEIKSWLNKQAKEIDEFPISPKRLASLIGLIEEGKVSSSIASQNIFPEMLVSEEDPLQIAERLDLIQDSSEDSITEFVEQAIAAYPDKAEAYRQGNKGLLGLFMGEVMKLSQRKADPKAASQKLRELLEK
ncbi:MAG: Asp-tRNA(Asn)/Glu-tRNA(Gln) amidotransferase subunit GatB [Flavobacteriales bacterium]|nr:Asp-tRNA(Asn)/Glu-tRNA(Gln) amidotransferase subunit GatB [Flavobacteriales bacterium]